MSNLALPFCNPWQSDPTPYSWNIGLLVTSRNFFFSVEVFLFLGGFLSHFLFWPLLGPHVVYVVFLILILIVSCETCGVPAFLCMESSSMQFVILSFLDKLQEFHFFAKWHYEPKATSHERKPPFAHKSSFIEMKLNKDTKVWTYLHIASTHHIGTSLVVLTHPLGSNCRGWNFHSFSLECAWR
jgi:hypothetical protein